MLTLHPLGRGGRRVQFRGKQGGYRSKLRFLRLRTHRFHDSHGLDADRAYPLQQIDHLLFVIGKTIGVEFLGWMVGLAVCALCDIPSPIPERNGCQPVRPGAGGHASERGHAYPVRWFRRPGRP